MRNFKTTLAAVHSGVDVGILIGKDDIYAYKDGKKASDTPIGTKLTLALQNSRLTQLTVKYNHDPLPKVDDTIIDEACSSGQFLYVQIPDCVVNVYSTDNGIGMTGTAQTAQLVKMEK